MAINSVVWLNATTHDTWCGFLVSAMYTKASGALFVWGPQRFPDGNKIHVIFGSTIETGIKNLSPQCMVSLKKIEQAVLTSVWSDFERVQLPFSLCRETLYVSKQKQCSQ